MGCELILALDVPDRAAASRILDQVTGSLPWVKIGLQMFTAYGPEWVHEVSNRGFQIFLDLKLHDIPNTVARTVESLSPLPIRMLTLHASGGREMMAAAQSASRPDLWLLGVTVLTSMDGAGLKSIGVDAEPATQVERLGRLAIDAGVPGLVCSPLEIGALRKVSQTVKLVTPGIRPAPAVGAGGAKPDDQKRVLTPADAAKAGADFIVVGRPILEAPNPAEAAKEIARQCRAQP
ncbi:MAG TPA: orotidine-5'-phosphate decarboxylase [Opitutaceae bacterium]|jgi:orotidine-5'-phosphate decarboxylase